MKYKLRKTPDEVLAGTRASVTLARDLAGATPRPTSSSTPRTPAAPSPSSSPRCSTSPIEAGATTINIPDTVGYALPREFGDLIRELIGTVRRSRT